MPDAVMKRHLTEPPQAPRPRPALDAPPDRAGASRRRLPRRGRAECCRLCSRKRLRSLARCIRAAGSPAPAAAGERPGTGAPARPFLGRSGIIAPGGLAKLADAALRRRPPAAGVPGILAGRRRPGRTRLGLRLLGRRTPLRRLAVRPAPPCRRRRQRRARGRGRPLSDRAREWMRASCRGRADRRRRPWRRPQPRRFAPLLPRPLGPQRRQRRRGCPCRASLPRPCLPRYLDAPRPFVECAAAPAFRSSSGAL